MSCGFDRCNFADGCAAKPGFFRKLWRFLHLLTWGVTIGTAVWMTFMSGRLLQQNMPREQFRTVQTKLFPSYLRFLTAGEGALTFLYALMSRSSMWQILNLLILVGTTAYNAFVLEPQTTKVRLRRLRDDNFYCLYCSNVQN